MNRNELLYESEFEYFLLDNLNKFYNIENCENIFSYTFIRYIIVNKIKKMKDIKNELTYTNKLIIFILDELNIPIYENKYILYKDTKINISSIFGQSISNIIDNLITNCSLNKVKTSEGNIIEWEDYIFNISKDIIFQAENKSKKYKKDTYYKYLYLYFALDILNDKFKANISPLKRLNHILYPNTYIEIKRTLEEVSRGYMDNYKYSSVDINLLSELEVENYLKVNLNKIEKGLIFVDSQYIIKDGIIDILARDKDNNDVLIELKIKDDDERLIWQTIYYPIQFKCEHYKSNVRMITVAPNYSEKILTVLNTIDDVEVFTFIPKIEQGKIKGIKLKKIKERKKDL